MTPIDDAQNPGSDAITHEQWMEEGKRLFGPDVWQWKFICPACKWVASVQEWKDAGADENEAAFSCIGRRKPIPTQCNYAGGGLFKLNPVRVTVFHKVWSVFAFAPSDHVQPTEPSPFR